MEPPYVNYITPGQSLKPTNVPQKKNNIYSAME